MPASVCQKLTSSTNPSFNESMWSDRGSADGSDIGGEICYIYVKVETPPSSSKSYDK